DAVVGIDIDYEIISDSMMMVSVSGTAVSLS
ncbi:MAG: heavy metal-binding domain-containing protein, partial [Sulfitobacter sp.]